MLKVPGEVWFACVKKEGSNTFMGMSSVVVSGAQILWLFGVKSDNNNVKYSTALIFSIKIREREREKRAGK